jgi:serine/threonine protein kinase
MDAFHELHKAMEDKIIIHRDIKLENIFLHNN